MKIKRKIAVFLWVVLGSAAWLWAGCNPYKYDNECDTVEDLDPEYFDGAACVDGVAGCDNGAEYCFYLKPNNEGKMRLRHGCLAEQCIRCEKGEFLCAFESDEAADGNDWVMCYQYREDCAGQHFFRL